MEQPRRYPIGIQTFSELPHGTRQFQIPVSEPSAPFRQVVAYEHAACLFRREERPFQRAGYRAVGDGMDILSGIAFRHEPGQAHGPEAVGKLSVVPIVRPGKTVRHFHRHSRQQYTAGEPDSTCLRAGRQVVVLIDEYDAPLLDVVHEEKDLPVLRNVMRNFYSPLKGCDPYLRFVFLTGITKFSQLSIFSELNNIQNISMLPEYAAVCGITQEEMEMQMDKDLDVLASRLELTREEMLQQLKDNYDGYHFTWPSPDLYNPFSLLNAFSEGRLNSYWFGSGTPTYLIEMLRKFQVIPQEIGGRKCEASDFDAPTERMTDITPLLYQSGYLTIKDYSAFSQLYLLDLPNREVRIGLMKSLLVNYVQRPSQINTLVGEMAEHIHFGRMEEALRLMQTVLSTVPYCEHTDYEGHYQQMLYLIFTLLGVEVRTPNGRVDMVMRTHSTLYVIELKLDKSAEAAMQQIDLKQYPERFALCGLPVVKVGINFDKEKRTLSVDGWEQEI